MSRMLDGMRMPTPTWGSRELGRALRAARSAGGSRTHTAQVMTDPDAEGVVSVLVGGETKSATLGASAREVRAGVRASVVKVGGEWVITSTSSGWRAPALVANPGAVVVDSSGGSNACTRAHMVYRALVEEVLPRLSDQYGAVEAARIVKEP